MKKIFEILGISAIIAFSFYYTEKAALYVQSKNPIMQSINEIKDEENIQSVNAIIENNTIIPGLYGKSVNVAQSFSTMKSFGIFNKYYLIFDDIAPKISLENHKDKIIISGNKSIRSVSLIIANDQSLIDYFTKKSIPVSLIINENHLNTNYQENIELLNSASKETNYQKVEKYLDKESKNKKICLTNTKVNISSCKQNENYLVKPSITLTINNLATIKSKITAGSIIFIEENSNVSDIEILLSQINYQGLEIVPLSNLIQENQNLPK